MSSETVFSSLPWGFLAKKSLFTQTMFSFWFLVPPTNGLFVITAFACLNSPLIAARGTGAVIWYCHRICFQRSSPGPLISQVLHWSFTGFSRSIVFGFLPYQGANSAYKLYFVSVGTGDLAIMMELSVGSYQIIANCLCCLSSILSTKLNQLTIEDVFSCQMHITLSSAGSIDCQSPMVVLVFPATDFLCLGLESIIQRAFIIPEYQWIAFKFHTNTRWFIECTTIVGWSDVCGRRFTAVLVSIASFNKRRWRNVFGVLWSGWGSRGLFEKR